LIGASYKGELPHFEISVKFFDSHIDLFEEKKLTLFSDFFTFLGPKNSFPHRKKKKKTAFSSCVFSKN
jgi:hypothetical protein